MNIFGGLQFPSSTFLKTTTAKKYINTAAAAKLLQLCPTLRPHRRQLTRLPRPWDSPGKNTGVGCHFLLQCMKVKSESEVAQSCLTCIDPMDCSLPGSSVHGIFQTMNKFTKMFGKQNRSMKQKRKRKNNVFSPFLDLGESWHSDFFGF